VEYCWVLANGSGTWTEWARPGGKKRDGGDSPGWELLTRSESSDSRAGGGKAKLRGVLRGKEKGFFGLWVFFVGGVK